MQRRKQRLDALVQAATRTAQREGRNVLVSAIEKIDRVDPLDVLESIDPALIPDRMFWSDPRESLSFAAIGSACVFGHSGPGRFTATDRDLKSLLDGAVIDGLPGDQRGVGPLAAGGFAFDDEGPSTDTWSGFGSSRLLLPLAIVTSSRDRTWLTLNLIVEPGSDSNRLTQSAAELAERLLDPAPMNFESSSFADEPVYSGNDDDFKSLVCDAVSEIERGNFDKVVLARAVRAECESEIDAFSVLRNLREVHRSAFVFGLWSEEKVFVGASPELLARQQGREVRASSLAGTIERGKSPEDDAAKARSLETSVKDRAEHAAVRDTLYEALSETCDDVVAPDEPVILSLNNVHHLHTPLSAQLKEGASFSALVEKLHPTPAVGGSPRDAALRFIRDNEGLDRGWYAAPVGWISAGSGEFAVALRSALIDGNRATLFAGCGIVMDSDPDMEVEESNLKLQTMKSALAVSMAAKPREAFESTAASRGAK